MDMCIYASFFWLVSLTKLFAATDPPLIKLLIAACLVNTILSRTAPESSFTYCY